MKYIKFNLSFMIVFNVYVLFKSFWCCDVQEANNLQRELFKQLFKVIKDNTDNRADINNDKRDFKFFSHNKKSSD